MPDPHCAEVNNHSVTRILKDQSSGIKDIGFEVSRGVFDYFSKPDFDALPPVLQGHFLQWSNREGNVCRMFFMVDNEYENLALATVLRPLCDFKFIVGKDGKSIPRLSERTRLREGAAADAEDEGPPRTVDIAYRENAIDCVQTWTYAKPDSIKVDARKGERFKPKINKLPAEYNTPFKMFLNVMLPPDFVNGFVQFANVHELGKPLCDQLHKATTHGEAIKFLMYIFALCLYPGDPIEDMWREASTSDHVVNGPGLGQWGISKNRFVLLWKCFGQLYPMSELEPDTSNQDPWRFSDFWLRCYNPHMARTIVPGWSLAPDEGMCPWDAPAGDRPFDIPHSTFEPRKPKNIGAELKMTMEGQCGVCMLAEVLKGAAFNATAKYRDEWNYTCAMNLRLADPWLHSPGGPERVFMADSHFGGVDEAECLLIKVACPPACVSLPALINKQFSLKVCLLRRQVARCTLSSM